MSRVLSALSSDVGVSHPTVRSWVSVFEASFVLFRVPPLLRNVRKRTIKAPKLHFADTGLACHLLGIRSADQLVPHPLRGALFESWVASEALKARVHAGRQSELYHLRETRGLEVDLVLEAEGHTVAVEAKSGATVAGNFFEGLRELTESGVGEGERILRLVYGGESAQTRHGVDVIPWDRIHEAPWAW